VTKYISRIFTPIVVQAQRLAYGAKKKLLASFIRFCCCSTLRRCMCGQVWTRPCCTWLAWI